MRRLLTAMVMAAAVTGAASSTAGAVPVYTNVPAGVWLKGPDVTVWWRLSQPWSPVATVRAVTLFARSGNTTLSSGPLVAAGVDSGSVTLQGLEHGRAYGFSLRATQVSPFGVDQGPVFDLGVHAVDATIPTDARLLLNGGAAYTNRFTVTATASASDTGSGVTWAEFRPDLANAGRGCDRTEANPDGSGCYQVVGGTITRDITFAAGPDGRRIAGVGILDAAYAPCRVSPPGTFDTCRHENDGNRSGSFASIIVDTTPPTVTLAGVRAGVAGEPVALDASASTDATSGIPANGYRWDFGDGSPVTENGPARVAHVYPGPGSYPLQVRATDRAGNTGLTRATVTVGLNVTVTPDPVPVPPPPDPGPAVPAPPAPLPVVTPPQTAAIPPRLLSISVIRRDHVRVVPSDAAAVRVTLLTPSRRPIGRFTQRFNAGGNRLVVPPRLLARIRTRLVIVRAQVLVDGVPGDVRSRRVLTSLLDGAS